MTASRDKSPLVHPSNEKSLARGRPLPRDTTLTLDRNHGKMRAIQQELRAALAKVR